MSYLDLYLGSPHSEEPFASLMALLLLGLMRILPIIALVPFLGAKNLNRPAKIGLGITIVVILFPKLLFVTHSPLTFNLTLVCYAFKELCVGFSLGMLTAAPFFVAESAGILIDHQRGASSLMVNDPIFLNQNAPTGVLFNYVGIVIFFWLNGPFIFLNALITSYEVIPPDVFISPLVFAEPSPFFQQAVSLLNKEMSIAIQLAIPSLLLMLMTDCTLGIINRLAPQVMITFLGMPLKSLLGIAIVWLGWFILIKQFAIEYMSWMNILKEAVHWFGIGSG